MSSAPHRRPTGHCATALLRNMFSLLAIVKACTAPERGFAYEAPRYFPFPSFRVVLETKRGRCNLASPPGKSRARKTHCAAFSRGDEMMPEPFVVQTIASFLAPRCLDPERWDLSTWDPSEPRCSAVDLGGNLGIHSMYMASLGATVDVVEPSADLAASIRRSARANCWEKRVKVHAKGITSNDTLDGR